VIIEMSKLSITMLNTMVTRMKKKVITAEV